MVVTFIYHLLTSLFLLALRVKSDSVFAEDVMKESNESR